MSSHTNHVENLGREQIQLWTFASNHATLVVFVIPKFVFENIRHTFIGHRINLFDTFAYHFFVSYIDKINERFFFTQQTVSQNGQKVFDVILGVEHGKRLKYGFDRCCIRNTSGKHIVFDTFDDVFFNFILPYF
jgi:hypothetical protein